MVGRAGTTGMVIAGAVLAFVSGCNTGPPAPLAKLPSPALALPAPPELPGEPTVTAPPADQVPKEWIAQGYRAWRHVVVHHSATAKGNAAEFDAMHRARGWDALGYHFVIDNGQGGPDGRVEVGARWTRQKWGAHTGGTPNNEYNTYGIGICLVGDFTDHLPSDAQLASLRRLLRYVMARYEIPADRVIGHRDAPNAKTECPGAKLHAHVRNRLLPGLVRKPPARAAPN